MRTTASESQGSLLQPRLFLECSLWVHWVWKSKHCVYTRLSSVKMTIPGCLRKLCNSVTVCFSTDFWSPFESFLDFEEKSSRLVSNLPEFCPAGRDGSAVACWGPNPPRRTLEGRTLSAGQALNQVSRRLYGPLWAGPGGAWLLNLAKYGERGAGYIWPTACCRFLSSCFLSCPNAVTCLYLLPFKRGRHSQIFKEEHN